MAEVHLTLRALIDIDGIDGYSTRRWGAEVAGRYLADLYAGMKRLEDSPGLLLKRSQRSLRLRFYQVREHMLVCDVVGDRIYLLCLIYGGMDLPNRIAELEPQLVVEAEVLHRKLSARDG
jgi:plasmid stabilization system protein ParE